jgi:thiamine-phosphate diphosphorylase
VAVNLPRLYAITGAADSARAWWRRFEAMLDAGHTLVQLRCRQDDPETLERRARRAAGLCRSAGARLLLNGPVSLVRALDLAGIHLSSDSLVSYVERPLSRRRLVGASCHSAAELALAQRLGADFACLSPVLPTRSHPGAPSLGFERFAKLAGDCGIPVYALGGLGPEDLDRVVAAGGYGVAGISAFWG